MKPEYYIKRIMEMCTTGYGILSIPTLFKKYFLSVVPSFLCLFTGSFQCLLNAPYSNRCFVKVKAYSDIILGAK